MDDDDLEDAKLGRGEKRSIKTAIRRWRMATRTSGGGGASNKENEEFREDVSVSFTQTLSISRNGTPSRSGSGAAQRAALEENTSSNSQKVPA
ncbi:hypothetical protein CF326_g8164 [Tilletia indica]|nr:hypothetical protein CF326_g8164 [Tilletia indica]